MVTSSARVTVWSVVSVLLLVAAPVFAQNARDAAGASPEPQDPLPVEVRVTVSELQGRTVTASWTYQLQAVATPDGNRTRRSRLLMTTPVRSIIPNGDNPRSEWWSIGPDITYAVNTRADGRFMVSLSMSGVIPGTGAGTSAALGAAEALASLREPLRLNIDQTGVLSAGQTTQIVSMTNPMVPGASTRIDATVTPIK